MLRREAAPQRGMRGRWRCSCRRHCWWPVPWRCALGAQGVVATAEPALAGVLGGRRIRAGPVVPAGSNLALQYGASRLDAHTTAVVMISEVLFASASALAWGAGQLTPQVAAGGALIVGAALLAAWRPRAGT
jgi:drug/metabolite transporter (DMT)-like permease